MSMAISQAVLEVVEEEGLQEKAWTVGAYLLTQLRELGERHECVGDVRGMGLCVGVELVTDRQTREPAVERTREIVARLVYRILFVFSTLLSSTYLRLLKDYRIAARVDGLRGNVIVVKPPLCVTMDNAKELVSALDGAILA